MASGSLRKKHNRRSDLKPQISMASSSSPLFNFRKVSHLVSATLIIAVIVLLTISSNMQSKFGTNAQSINVYSIEVVNEFPHDPNAFTQGLLYKGHNTLYESTGLYGRSSIRRVALQTGKAEVIQKMDDKYFGEGLTLLGERLFQVTWLEKTGFIYERNNLSKFETFTHDMQDGWGLTDDGEVLFGSDGSSTLYQLDSRTLKVTERHTVKYKGHEVYNLNELEYINGEVWANVWQTDCIARISPKDGSVLGWILLHNLRQGLIASGNTNIDVLNGIAWDIEQKRIFVTGKLWPKLYEIKLHQITKPVHTVIENSCLTMPTHFAKP